MSWFLTHRPRPDAAVRLFCLPPAGAGASVYRDWLTGFGPTVEVRAVQLPGRENRIAEPLAVEPQRVAAALAAQADRPYALFGHSMGGRVAFEAVRQLRADRARLPELLFVAACRPPDLDGDGPLSNLSRLDESSLMDRLVTEGSLPPEVAADPDLRELFLPMLRADFRWVDDYRYVPGPPLPVPVVGYAGDADRAVSESEMAGWERHTSAGFTLHTVVGGHFFPYHRAGELTGMVERELQVAMPHAGSVAP